MTDNRQVPPTNPMCGKKILTKEFSKLHLKHGTIVFKHVKLKL